MKSPISGEITESNCPLWYIKRIYQTDRTKPQTSERRRKLFLNIQCIKFDTLKEFDQILIRNWFNNIEVTIDKSGEKSMPKHPIDHVENWIIV